MCQEKSKPIQLFPSSLKSPKLDQKGQSFIEFVLLMLMVIGLSYGYMKIVNGNLATRWAQMVNIVINDHGTDFSRHKVNIP